jgi:hypothetical protein
MYLTSLTLPSYLPTTYLWLPYLPMAYTPTYNLPMAYVPTYPIIE